MLTGGLKNHGWLQQEFRHLEILDEITRLRCSSKLPTSVKGERRQSLLDSWCKSKGKQYTPSQLDAELHWTGTEILEGFHTESIAKKQKTSKHQ
ncbi:hypothetical protein BDP27DRAFT_1221496, partial [Rhodocollybia butyracea]